MCISVAKIPKNQSINGLLITMTFMQKMNYKFGDNLRKYPPSIFRKIILGNVENPKKKPKSKWHFLGGKLQKKNSRTSLEIGTNIRILENVL